MNKDGYTTPPEGNPFPTHPFKDRGDGFCSVGKCSLPRDSSAHTKKNPEKKWIDNSYNQILENQKLSSKVMYTEKPDWITRFDEEVADAAEDIKHFITQLLKEREQEIVDETRKLVVSKFKWFHKRHQNCMGIRLVCDIESDIEKVEKDLLSSLNKDYK